ncbi:MAG: tetratricopeptide repeat protein [Terracidiphilus sp.]|nr:tetratricopeptide repeat protein [Terracidiphilus sp.]
MTRTKQIPALRWTRERAALLALVCLMLGIGGGWWIRGLRTSAAAGPASASAPATAPQQAGAAGPQGMTPERMKAMADEQAAPLLAKLKADRLNPDLLTSLGNLYYDAQQYPLAVDYYGRVLKIKPAEVSVRTDMATAYWYLGNNDTALAEFDKALTYMPNNPNTLFNRGLVKWKAKGDAAGAVADWQKLLAANPNYEGKDKVQQMLTEVQSNAGARPGK